MRARHATMMRGHAQGERSLYARWIKRQSLLAGRADPTRGQTSPSHEAIHMLSTPSVGHVRVMRWACEL